MNDLKEMIFVPYATFISFFCPLKSGNLRFDIFVVLSFEHLDLLLLIQAFFTYKRN